MVVVGLRPILVGLKPILVGLRPILVDLQPNLEKYDRLTHCLTNSTAALQEFLFYWIVNWIAQYKSFIGLVKTRTLADMVQYTIWTTVPQSESPLGLIASLWISLYIVEIRC